MNQGRFGRSAVYLTFTALCLLAATFSHSAASDDEIQALIQAVETSDCVFIRNGSEHGPAEAGDHLRLKLRRGKRYASTPESFIKYLASKSSWTGEEYWMECDGQRYKSGDWLTGQLARIRGNSPGQ